jgi:hypothetical protein
LLTKDQQNRAVAFAHYANGELAEALHFWRAQPSEPTTLWQLSLVAECMASAGELGADKYIDTLAETLPLDAEAIRAELLIQQGDSARAGALMERFLQSTHDNAWQEQGLIRRSLSRAEFIASQAPSNTTARRFYDILSTPLAVWNCDADRLARLVGFGLQLDASKPGKCTAAALRAFEPNLVWQRKFLEIRKTCYENMRDPRAATARSDLDEFITQQAFTADAAALTRVFKSNSEAAGYATEVRKDAKR